MRTLGDCWELFAFPLRFALLHTSDYQLTGKVHAIGVADLMLDLFTLLEIVLSITTLSVSAPKAKRREAQMTLLHNRLMEYLPCCASHPPPPLCRLRHPRPHPAILPPRTVGVPSHRTNAHQPELDAVPLRSSRCAVCTPASGELERGESDCVRQLILHSRRGYDASRDTHPANFRERLEGWRALAAAHR
jgi:hypothetical protein